MSLEDSISWRRPWGLGTPLLMLVLWVLELPGPLTVARPDNALPAAPQLTLTARSGQLPEQRARAGSSSAASAARGSTGSIL